MDEASYLNQILNSGKIGILDWQLTQDTLLISKSLQNMLGYPNNESDMTRYSIETLIPEKDQIEINKAINELQAKKKTEFSIQHVMIQNDSFHCWVLHNGTISYNKKGEPTRLISSIINITKLKVSEVVLKEPKERYRALFESTNEGLLLLDKDHNKILYANETIAQMVEYPIDKLIKMNFSEITSEGIEIKLAEIIQIKHSILTNITLRRSNNEYIYVDINYIRTTIDEKEYYICLIRDVTKRKEYEFSILESKRKYHTYIANAPYGIFIFDENGNFLEVNDAACNMLGYTESELLLLKINDIINPKSIQESKSNFKILLEKGKVNIVENCITKNGISISLSINSVEIDENQYIAFAQDITEKLKTEQRLIESEEQFKKIVEQSFDVVIMRDNNGVIQYTSPNITKTFGYADQELIGKNIKDYVISNELTKIKQSIQTISKGKIINRLFTKFKKKDGTFVEVEINSSPIYKDNEIIGACGFLNDVTEQNRTLQKLKDSEDKYKNITERSFDAIYVIDRSLNLEYISPSMTLHFGHKPEIVIGQSVLNYVPEYDIKATKLVFDKVFSGNKIEFDEAHIVCADGSVSDLEVNIVPVYKNKVIVGAQGMIRDVTERNESRKKLEQAETKYQNLFESAPVSIWREDFSEIKYYIDSLKIKGIDDFEKYFDKYPEEVMKCVKLLKVIDINSETINLLKAKDKDEVLSSLDKVFTIGAIKTFKYELLCLISNKNKFSSESTIKTFDNKTINVMISVSLDYSVKDWSNVLISIVDITDLKKTEVALIESEEKYRELFDESVAAIYLFDAQKNFIDSNQAGLDLLGYSREELSTMSISDVDAEPADVVDAHKELVRGINLIDFEHKLRRKDGKIITVLNNSKTNFDKNCNITTIQSTLLDITERKQVEKELKESERKYRNLFEVAQEGIWVLDAKSYTTLVNKSMSDMLGYTEGEMIGKHLFEFMDDHGIKISKENIKRREAGIKEQHDFEFLTKNGKRVITTIETAPIFDKDKNYIGAIAGVIDITDRKAAENELLASKKQYDQILDRSNAVVYIKDLQHKYLYANAVFYNLFKLIPENFINKTDYDLFDKEQAEIFIANDLRVATEQKHIRIHEKVIHNNIIHTYISDKFPLYDSDGKLYATCGISTDITDIIEAQQKEKDTQQLLVRKDRLINAGQLAAAVAHEINNPLTVLHGSLEEIKESKDAPHEDIIDSMLSVSRRMKKIINSLLIFTHQKFNLKQIMDINIIINNTFLLISNILIKSSIEYTLELSDEKLETKVDQVRIQQVFINLIFNAMHAMKKGGKLKVKSYVHKDSIIISFEDTGSGISEENMKSIFLPFFTTKEVGEGTGLGLSISHGIIEEHNGTISVVSQLNEGSTFTIKLPIIKDQ